MPTTDQPTPTTSRRITADGIADLLRTSTLTLTWDGEHRTATFIAQLRILDEHLRTLAAGATVTVVTDDGGAGPLRHTGQWAALDDRVGALVFADDNWVWANAIRVIAVLP